MVSSCLVEQYCHWSHCMAALDPENIGKAVGISLLSCEHAEIYVFEVWRPPSWISHFRLGHTIFLIVLLDSWTSKTWIEPCFRLRYEYFQFGGRHLGQVTSGLVIQHFCQSHWIAWPGKHGGSLWNFVPTLYRSWDLGTPILAIHFLVYKFTREQHFISRFSHQKMWKWIAERYTEAFEETVRIKGVEKYREVVIGNRLRSVITKESIFSVNSAWPRKNSW